ncbi:MAG: stage III sporulation protein AE [Clostridiaceae bacterium]
MKKIIIIVITIIILSFSIGVQASEVQETGEQILNKNGYVSTDDKEIESLYNYLDNMKNEYEVIKDMDFKSYVNNYIKSGSGNFSFYKFIVSVFSYAFRNVAYSFKDLGLLIIICILCSLLSLLERAFENSNANDMAYFAAYSLILIVLTNTFYSSASIAIDAINKIADFMAALIPVLLLLLASLGGFAEATIMDPLIIGSINIITRIYIDFVIPLIFMAFVLSFVNSLSKEYKLSNFTKLINQVALWIQGGMLTIFIGMISIKGITAQTMDQVTAKTAKFAVDSFVPIVGKCLSDAVSTVAGYSLLLKNAVGVVGLLIIILIAIYPIVELFILSLLFKLTASIIEPVGDKRIVSLVNSVGDSILMLMSCLISVSFMFFIIVAIVASLGSKVISG